MYPSSKTLFKIAIGILATLAVFGAWCWIFYQCFEIYFG